MVPAPEEDDRSLIARVRSGDNEALGALYARHAPVALRYAARSTRHSDAEDVVAEAFHKVTGALSRGSGPTDHFLPYLLTAVRTVLIDRAKRLKRDALLSSHDFPTIGPHHSTGPLGGGPMERAFRSLPPRWQSVLWCTEVLQMDPQEVGEQFGLTPNAASALAYRARTNLRSAYQRFLAEDDLDVMGTITLPDALLGGVSAPSTVSHPRQRPEEDPTGSTG